MRHRLLRANSIFYIGIAILLLCIMGAIFATTNLAYAATHDDNISAKYITNTDYYANLTAPKLVASNANNIVAINDSHITNVRGNISKQLTITANYKVIDIAISDSIVYVLTRNDEDMSYQLYYYDYDLEAISAILPTAIDMSKTPIVDIFNTDDTVYFVCAAKVYTASYNEENTTVTMTAISHLENTNINSIAVYNGKYYSNFSTQNIFMYNDTENKFKLKYTVDTKNYVIANNNLYYLSGNNLIIKSDGNEQLSSSLLPFTPSYIALGTNGTILITSSVEGRIYTYNIASSTIDNYYGDSGNTLDRLNTPTSISTSNRYAYVADSGNNRIIKTSIDTNTATAFTLGVAPILVTSSNNIIAYTSKNNNTTSLHIYGNSNAIYTTTNTIIDLQSRGSQFYALVNTGEIIAIATSGTATTLPNIIGATNIALPEHSAYLYYTANKQLFKYNLQNASATDMMIAINGSFAVDYNGSVYDISNNIITKYSTPAITKKVINIDNNDSIVDYTLCNNTGNIYAITSKHRMLSIASSDINTASFDNDNYQPPTNYDIIKTGTLDTHTTDDIIGYLSAPSNLENTRIVDKSEWFIVLAEVTDNSKVYYYTTNKVGSQFMYIEKKYFKELPSNTTCDYLVTTLSSNVYVRQYPYDSADIQSALLNNITVKALDKLTNSNGWDWYYITYTELGATKYGYIKCNDVVKSSSIQNDYMQIFKVKSNKIGYKVKLYAMPSLDSEVLFGAINDGEEIQAYQIDTASEFTRVYYKDTYGYILTQNLIKASALTPNQILAITVSVGSVVALSLIILISVYIKRHKKNNRNLLDDDKYTSLDD